MSIIEKLIAGFIERSCKNYVTTIIGIVCGMVGAYNACGNLIPAAYQTYVGLAVTGAAAVALILAKDKGLPASTVPTVGKLGVLLLGLMALPAGVHAQTATTGTATSATAASTTTGFSASSGALALYYNGAWSAAATERESFDLVDWGATKANHFSLQGMELEMPGPGVNLYMGGVSVRPNISSLFNKTNLPANSLGVWFDANLGNGVPTTGASHISWLAGGGVLYNFTNALTWQPLTVQYGRFGGAGFAAMSTQLQFMFGK